MTEDFDRGVPLCLICNASIGVSTRNNCPIFKLNVTSSEQPIANILSVILGQEVREESVHSDIICKKCFKLCNEVDELQERLAEIKMEINNYYQRTLRKLEGLEDEEEPAGGSQSLYPVFRPNKTPTGSTGRRPGRPRKYPLPPPPQPVDNIQEVGVETLLSDDVIVAEENKEIVEEDEDVEEDLVGVGMDDERDVDYVPASRQFSGLKRLQDALISGNKDLQIKLEVDDQQEVSSSTDKLSLKSKTAKKKEFDNLPSVIPRMIVSRDNKLYTCLICSADDKFQGEAKTIISHMRVAHEIRLFICEICGAEFLKRNELGAHFEEHVTSEEGQQAEIECDVCHRIFTNLRLFRVHKRMHVPQSKNHVCETCGKAFLSKNMLEEHNNSHIGLRPYKCSVCSKDFASKYSARSHERTHLDRPRPHKCSHCGKGFITEQHLGQHEKIHLATRTHTCQICGKSFSSARNLEVHCVIHTGYRPFRCRICGKSFTRKAELRDHERTHTGEKPYQCEFCGATFGQRSNLQSHKRATHYDDKRYQCIECGKAFKRRRLLDYHIKAAHTGERPYKCQICNATFIYPEHFKKHRRIHTGEKPYQCEVCGKAFNSRDNRNAHRFVHSDKKPYECLVCGMGFMRKPLLYNHMQSQGHVNDTIVVNQPRLTSEEDYLGRQEGVHVEMSILDGTKWTQETIEENEVEGGEQETKVYISELKEHVILQTKDETSVEQETEQYTAEEVGHLIIDGQVQLADGETLELEGGASLAETLEHHSLVTAGGFTVGTSGDPGDGGGGTGGGTTATTTTVQTPTGAVHLVHINLADSSDQQGTWFNIVPQ